jgi:hypothetical protein
MQVVRHELLHLWISCPGYPLFTGLFPSVQACFLSNPSMPKCFSTAGRYQNVYMTIRFKMKRHSKVAT